jgi:hypothetical protein
MEQFRKEQDDRLNKLFSGEDITEEPPKKEEPVKEEPAKEEPVKEEPAKEEPPKKGVEEGDIDFTKPPEGTTEKERETAAQKRARENGQELATLKTTHQETLLELERLRAETETLKKSATQPQYREEDFLSHPEVAKITSAVINDRNSVAATQSVPEAGDILKSRFGNYMMDFIAQNAEDDQAAARAMQTKLHSRIAEDFKTAFIESKKKEDPEFDPSDINAAELNADAKVFTKDVLQLLVRNADKTQAVQDRISELSAKAREGMLAQGVEVYQHHETDLSTSIKAVEALPQVVIDQNPHSVEATVATLLKQPAWKARFEEVRRKVLELTLGPRALTQEDIDKTSQSGVDVRKFNKERQKKFLDDRRKLVATVTQALMLTALWEQTSRKAAQFDDSNDELEALSHGKEKKGDPPPAPEPKKKATEYVSAIEPILAEVGRR